MEAQLTGGSTTDQDCITDVIVDVMVELATILNSRARNTKVAARSENQVSLMFSEIDKQGQVRRQVTRRRGAS